MPPIPVCVVAFGVELMADIAEPECELVPEFWLAIDIEDEAAMLIELSATQALLASLHLFVAAIAKHPIRS
jgi:hypothetical protein